MISYFQAIILGGLQGVTELFPISSLGHSVILPSLFGWNIDQHSDLFLIFLVATHLATAIVLFGFFFTDWMLIIKGIIRSIKIRQIDQKDVYAKLGWLIIVASIPVGILGLLFENTFKSLFAYPLSASIFLILNGFLLYGAEILRKKKKESTIGVSDENISKISWLDGVKVGFAECLALLPGFSRTGSTIGGGLLIGLNHEDATRFSFLLAAPIILAAAVLKLPELSLAQNASNLGIIIVGAITSAMAAYLSVRYLMKYFQTKKLTPFSLYCVLAGILASVIILIR